MKLRPGIQKLQAYTPGQTIEGGIKLSSNENPLGSSPLALEALRTAFTDGAGGVELNRYPDGGAEHLRDCIADFWDISPDQVLVGNGSDEIMVMIAGAFIESGLNAITGRHTFSQYTFATTIFGGEVRYCDMVDGRFDLGGISRLVDSDTRLIFLCNPNNPTATGITHDELVVFLRSIPDHVVVVLDEAYGEFANQESYPRAHELMRTQGNIMRLRTFSKIYGLAGLRIGYATSNPELIDAAARLRQPFNVDSLAQRAAAVALSDTTFVEKSIRNNTAGRARICDALDDLGIPYFPSEANFVCAHFGERLRSVLNCLGAKRIAVRPLDSFLLPLHLRLSVGNPDEVLLLCNALRECLVSQT